MATKTNTRKPATKAKVVSIGSKRKAPTPPGQVLIRPALNTSDTPFFYANYVEVGHSNFEFTLFTARVPSKLTAEQQKAAGQTGRIDLPAELQISIPPRVALGLVRALQTQIQAYETLQGPIQPEKNDE